MVQLEKEDVAKGFLWFLDTCAQFKGTMFDSVGKEMITQYSILTASIIGEKATIECIQYYYALEKPETPTINVFLKNLKYED